MSVETPSEPSYYFECSFGRIRLTYFVPADHLSQMVSDGRINQNVLKDFPDGVDIDCTEPDFEEFKVCYGFRPEYNADLLRDSFFAMYSTTRDWKSFHGTGFVKAAELERNVETVKETFASEEILPDTVRRPIPMDVEFPKRRDISQAQTQMQTKIAKALIDLQVEDVAADKTINQQPFARVPMSGKKTAADVFQNLHQKRNR